MSKIILAVDIGSSKICSVVAELKDSTVQIIGTGYSKSRGIKKGAVTNIDLASRAIRESVEDAKRITGVPLPGAIISLSGTHTKSFNARGLVNVVDKEVKLDSINMVLDNAVHGANIPRDYEVVHVLPYRFKLDEQDNDIDDPIGMTGRSLQVDAHIVTVQKASLDNLKKSIILAGIKIENIVLSSYAASISVLNEDERQLGIACVDMGANTCELMIYKGNSMRYNDFLGVGSNHISNDIARILSTPIEIAEAIKKEYGNLIPNEEGSIEIPKIGNTGEKTEVGLDLVHNIVYARVSETLVILKRSIEASGLSDKINGVVLTGGMVNLKGIRDFAAVLFNPLSVRLAQPAEVGGLFATLKDPSSAVAVGLLLYGAGHFTNYEKDSQNVIRSKYENANMLQSDYTNDTYENNEINKINLEDLKVEENLDQKEQEDTIKQDSFFGKVAKVAQKLFG
ncbi:cell division protein FtsA [Helicobacter muridarum]|uniref:Cell division protein FtsA n=1 Tax=Helicobacter muridarum TaxID=216 RepID=A0A099U0I7_9HELI|nr:cell division protein FtsA [Helicobacter muridarum]TLD99596.1 cell division protein FtsA [Helicobacter muridarum]STQ86794.1 Cell division protein FtsA [Helicobacter muridarum]